MEDIRSSIQFKFITAGVLAIVQQQPYQRLSQITDIIYGQRVFIWLAYSRRKVNDFLSSEDEGEKSLSMFLIPANPLSILSILK